ncbi:hypothetical protein G6F62_008322 [Rhizopus arrhizus]|nr:hypothetical protein G6F62_008322 [Rhizopus arrhizus]
MNFYYENGRGDIVDDSGNEPDAYLVEPSFRLTNLTNLKKYIKNKKVPLEDEANDVEMKGSTNKKRKILYEKLMTPSQAAKAANVQYETARKWKTANEKNPEEDIPLKKTNRVNRPVSKLNEEHKTFIQNFFDENKTAVIQDAVESLTKNFEGLEIKKSRVAEFMKEDCNLTIKVVTRHPKRRNCSDTLEKRAQFVKEWTEKGMLFMQNCVFIDESGFDINMRRSRGWSTRGTQAVYIYTIQQPVFASDSLKLEKDEFCGLKNY